MEGRVGEVLAWDFPVLNNFVGISDGSDPPPDVKEWGPWAEIFAQGKGFVIISF